MSSYRKRTQTKPTTAAGLRAQASANGSSIFRNRPRSFSGCFPSSQNSYSSLFGFSPLNSYQTSPSSFSAKKREFLKNKYSNSAGNLNYPAAASFTTYGGTATGYGGLTLPITNLGLNNPSTSYGYSRGDKFQGVQRKGSLGRTRAKPGNSSFGSRSSSLQSLASSEGYASGHERSERSSRIGSVTSLSSDTSAAPIRSKSVASENGELDYKKLYEESQAENERLREKLRRSDEQLKDARSQLDKSQSAQNKSTLSESEKRERRAMERKLSEMEEELKVMEQLKCENQRLKDENGALIRVISKLSK